MKCGYDSIVGDIYRELSDQQGLVWAASTALFPRYYLIFGSVYVWTLLHLLASKTCISLTKVMKCWLLSSFKKAIFKPISCLHHVYSPYV